jgi:hypothetical protein
VARSTAWSTSAAKWSHHDRMGLPCDKHHHEVARRSTNWA